MGHLGLWEEILSPQRCNWGIPCLLEKWNSIWCQLMVSPLLFQFVIVDEKCYSWIWHFHLTSNSYFVALLDFTPLLWARKKLSENVELWQLTTFWTEGKKSLLYCLNILFNLKTVSLWDVAQPLCKEKTLSQRFCALIPRVFSTQDGVCTPEVSPLRQ